MSITGYIRGIARSSRNLLYTFYSGVMDNNVLIVLQFVVTTSVST